MRDESGDGRQVVFSLSWWMKRKRKEEGEEIPSFTEKAGEWRLSWGRWRWKSSQGSLTTHNNNNQLLFPLVPISFDGKNLQLSLAVRFLFFPSLIPLFLLCTSPLPPKRLRKTWHLMSVYSEKTRENSEQVRREAADWNVSWGRNTKNRWYKTQEGWRSSKSVRGFSGSQVSYILKRGGIFHHSHLQQVSALEKATTAKKQ